MDPVDSLPVGSASDGDDCGEANEAKRDFGDYFHAQRSEIEPHLWHTTEAGFEPVLRAPSMWSWWESNQWRFAPEFGAYVKTRQAEAKARRADLEEEPSS